MAPAPPAISSGGALDPGARPFSSLGHFMATVSARHAGRTALVADRQAHSYADLGAAASRVAGNLLDHGVQPGETVAVLLPNGFEWIVTVYGAQMIGVRTVLLPIFSAPPEQESALRSSGAVALLTVSEVGGRPLLEDLGRHLGGWEPAAVQARLPELRAVLAAGVARARGSLRPLEPLIDGTPSASPDEVASIGAGVQATDDAVVIFTSGTSGSPKPVLHAHGGALLQFDVWRGQLGLQPDDRVFSTYPFCWSSGFVRLGANLLTGARLITMAHFDAGEALAAMAEERATVVTQPGPHLDRRLVEHPSWDPAALRSITRVQSRVLPDVLDSCRRMPIFNYGLTEAFTLVTGTPPLSADGTPPDHLGRPHPGWSIKILDPETGEVVRCGEIGRIAVKGPGLMRRYLDRPAEECFDDDGYFVTADLGSVDVEGNLRLSGRIDDVVRSGGVNVSTLELERELAGFPGARVAVALGVPHPTLGQAMVVGMTTAEEVSEDDVQAWLQPRMASYKRPRRVVFLDESDVAYTTTQKVDRTRLRQVLVERIDQAGGWEADPGS